MFGFEAGTLVIIAVVALFAFIVRARPGFGSSLIGVGALSMVLPPAQVVGAAVVVALAFHGVS